MSGPLGHCRSILFPVLHSEDFEYELKLKSVLDLRLLVCFTIVSSCAASFIDSRIFLSCPKVNLDLENPL